MPESLQKKTTKGLAWSFLERLSVQGTQFVVMVIMARILSPRDYGLVGLLAVFIAVSQSIVDSGFSQALIRKQSRTEVDNSTVFYFNIVVGVLMYLLLYAGAPYIAIFYNEPELVNITRVLGLSVIFNSLVVVQRALLMSKINFKLITVSAFGAVMVSGTVGILMAYGGYGVWSIVAQQILNLGVNAVLLWFMSKWHPIIAFSWISFRELFGFGSKLLASGLLATIYNNLYLLIIGKFFSAAELGYYTRAHQFSDFPSANLTSVIQRVTYPAMCQIDDDNRLSDVYRKLIRMSGYAIFPILMFLAAISVPLVLWVLTDTWLFVATLLPILCLSMMWYPIHSLNLNLLQVKGRSDLYLRLEIIKKVLGVVIICATIPLGIVAMCWGSVASSLIALVINTYYTGKLINVGFLVQMRDLLPSLLLSFTMAAIVYLTMAYLPLSNAMKVFAGLAEGVIIYALLSWLMRCEEFGYIVNYLKLDKRWMRRKQ